MLIYPGKLHFWLGFNCWVWPCVTIIPEWMPTYLGLQLHVLLEATATQLSVCWGWCSVNLTSCPLFEVTVSAVFSSDSRHIHQPCTHNEYAVTSSCQDFSPFVCQYGDRSHTCTWLEREELLCCWPETWGQPLLYVPTDNGQPLALVCKYWEEFWV